MMIICYYIVGTVLSPVNPLIDTLPHQVIPQYENVEMMITSTLPTTELKMNTCAYGVINN